MGLFANFDHSMTAPPLPGDPDPSLPLVAAGLAHPGQQRPENEDAFGSFAEHRLFIVADGMGGHNAGEVASAMAIDTVEGFFTSFHNDPRQVWPYGVDRALSLAANLLRVGIKVANDKIREAAAADRARARMGATVVAMAVGEKQIAIAHAGDSRAYRLRGGDADAAHARPFDRRGDARRASGDDGRGAGRLRSSQRRDAQPG